MDGSVYFSISSRSNFSVVADKWRTIFQDLLNAVDATDDSVFNFRQKLAQIIVGDGLIIINAITKL